MMSISVKKMTCTSIVKSLGRCPRGQGLYQMTPDFLSQRHNCTSQSTHLCQQNALLKKQQCHNHQTFRSSSSYLQSASVLQRKYLRHNITVIGKHSSVLTPCIQSVQLKSSGMPFQTSSFSTSVSCASTKDFTNKRAYPPWRILFFGSDTFSVVALKALNENRLQTESEFKVVESLEVVCPVQMTPVKEYSKEAGLNIHEWPVQVDKGKFDVGVLVSFGKLIPGRIINTFPYGIINIHPSLLPRWRGASPITHTILSGDTHAGVTIMELRAKHFDTGPILLKEALPVPGGSTSSQLADLLAILGVKLMLEALCNLPTLERLEVEQPCIGITYAPKLKPSMGNVDWENSTVGDIDRQYRALHHMMPLTSKYEGQKVKLYDMTPINSIPGDVIEARAQRLYNVSSTMVPPGRTLFLKHQQCLLIKCKDGWVGFQSFFVKKKISALDFCSSVLSRPGSVHNYFESPPTTSQTRHTDIEIPTATAVHRRGHAISRLFSFGK